MMRAHFIAMDIDGRLWIATHGPQGGPQMWEPMPLTDCGALRFPAVDAGTIERPEWAVDFYRLDRTDAEWIGSQFHNRVMRAA